MAHHQCVHDHVLHLPQQLGNLIMTIPAIPPQLDADELAIASRSIFHWRASDLSINAIDGLLGTFSHDSHFVDIVDSIGSSQHYTAGYMMPKWSSRSWLGQQVLGINMTIFSFLYWPAAWRPTTLAFWAEVVHPSTPVSGQCIWSVANTVVDGALLKVETTTGGIYRIVHDNGTGQVLSTMGVAPAAGDSVVIRGQLYADGSVQMWQSLNGAAETASSRSGARAMATSWGNGTARIGLNDFGGFSKDALWVRRLKVVRGVPDYATLARSF